MRHPTAIYTGAVNDTPNAPDDSQVRLTLDGEKLRNARLAAGLTSTQFAYLTGRSDRAVRYWETGHRHPEQHIIGHVAEVLGVPVNDLLA